MSKVDKKTNSDAEKIISFRKLRLFVGLTGISLPITCILGCLLFGDGEKSFQVSISHYYYSKMHIVFVGTLCILSGFFMTYNGKIKGESRLSNIAGCFALGIAAMPASSTDFLHPGAGGNQYLQLYKEIDSVSFWIHYGFAGCLFVCFVIFCLHFFQQPDEKYTGEELKKFERRKRIYKFCGWAIIVSLVCIGLFSFIIQIEVGLFKFSTLIFETISLWAFGIAWIIKGSAILKPKPVFNSVLKSIR